MESDLERDEAEILSFISGTWNESTVRKSEGYAKKLQEWLKTKKNVVSVYFISFRSVINFTRLRILFVFLTYIYWFFERR